MTLAWKGLVKSAALNHSEIIKIREKWRPQFEEKILKNHRGNLREDIIIRDIERLNDYLNSDFHDKDK